jgi:8-oxo-dGTP diphosphatase
MSDAAFTDRPTSSPDFIASLALKQVSAGCVLLDDHGRVLLVNPGYKDAWEIPGGAVEAKDSTWAACVREVRAELGEALFLEEGIRP